MRRRERIVVTITTGDRTFDLRHGPPSTVMGGLDPAIRTGSVVASYCLVRNTGARGDGRVKPGHDDAGRAL